MTLRNASSRLIASAIAAAMLLLSFACGGGGGGNPNPPAAGTVASMTTRINTARTAGGAATLDTNAKLAATAQAQADQNAAQGFNNDEVGGVPIVDRLHTAGYDFTVISFLFNNGDEATVFGRWTSNPAYNGILLSSDYDELGMGVAQGATMQWWVVIFASQGTPSSDTVQGMLDQLNAFRTANGQPELAINDNLAIAAQGQADLNAAAQHNDTVNGNGDNIEAQVAATGYSYATLMWDVANGDAATSVAGWTDTPEEQDLHNNPDLADVGIGVTVGGGQQWWVIIFGDPVT